MRRQEEFQIVCGLWLSPDFSDALARRKNRRRSIIQTSISPRCIVPC